jgi:hypothetical protein
LDKDRVFGDHRNDRPEDTEIIDAIRIGGGIVGHEEPKEDED